MPRIRYVKSDFFTDEKIGKLRPLARLFWMGMWCYADRKGRLEDKSVELGMKIMPYDLQKAKSETLMNELKKDGFIQRYKANGRSYIQIPNFEKHQRPHHTEKESVIPPHPDTEPEKTVKSTSIDGKKKEGMGMEKGMEKGMEMGRGSVKPRHHHRAAIPAVNAKTTAKDVPPEIGAIVQAYITAANLPFANDASRKNFIRMNRCQAEKLLQAANGDEARASAAVKNLVNFYIGENKRNFTMDWIIKDYPEWDKERLEYEQKKVPSA